jgi:hypothetical protein
MSPSFWPTPQDYNEAVQNPAVCMSDPDLKNGLVVTNAIGLPRAMTGAFASVYKIQNNDKDWAVRCFLSNRLAQHDRYEQVSKFVLMDDLECTIDFHYVEEGIKIRGEWFPLLKMPWVEGDTLDRYILKNYKNTEVMKQLLSDFHQMMADLERAQIGHGDLQHGNIIVTTEGLRLVDYDALFVPALAGKNSLELGHPNYQHPERTASHYDKDVDNFSAWLIHTALLAIAIDSALYEKYCDGDDSLLFRRTDLADPEKSELFDELISHPSAHIKEAATLIKRMLWAAPDQIPILDAQPEEIARLPNIESERQTGESPEPLTEEQVAAKIERYRENLQNNDFSFIDTDAAMVQTTLKRPRPPTALEKLPHLMADRWEKACLWFSVYSWVDQRMKKAKSLLQRGHTEDACKIYLKVYKVLTESNNTQVDDYFSCLLRLGCCYKVSETPALASNYFLLALQNVGNKPKILAAIYLAQSRFHSGDEAGATKLLMENVEVARYLPENIQEEIHFHWLDRSELYKMMINFTNEALRLEKPELVEAGALSTWIVLNRLVNTRSVELTYDLIQPIVQALATLEGNPQIDDVFRQIADFSRNSSCASRTSIDFLCAAVRSLQYTTELEPDFLVEATDWIIKSNISGKEDLQPLTTNLLANTTPERTRDLMMQLCHANLKNFNRDTAFDTMKIACQLTAEYDLEVTKSMSNGLDTAFLSTELITQDFRFFKKLIIQMGRDNKYATLEKIGRSLVDTRSTKELAQMLTVIKYGCPDAFYQKACEWLKFSETDTEIVSELLQSDLGRLARSLDGIIDRTFF